MNSIAAPSFFLWLITKKNFVAAVCLVVVASIFIYIHIFGINSFYLDDWSLVPMMKKYEADGFSFELFFKQHNEHRIFFPFILYIETVPLTHMNSLPYMYFNAFLLCIEIAFIFTMAKKQFGFSFSNVPVWFIIIPLFIFNFRQSQNILWAFQIAWYIILALAVLSFFFIEKFYIASNTALKIIYFLVAILCAVVATFSSAMGILIWMAAGIQLLLKSTGNSKFKNWIYIAAWSAVGALSVYFYVHGLQSPTTQNIEYIKSHPVQTIKFFFSLISLTYWSFHHVYIIALPLGITLFALSVYVLYKTYRNKRLKENSFWLALYSFSILFAIITMIGRCPNGLSWCEQPRYTIYTCLYIIATFMLFYDIFIHSVFKREKQFFQFLFIGLVFLSLELDGIGIISGKFIKKRQSEVKEIILNYKQKPLEPNSFFGVDFLKLKEEYVPYLDQRHYSSFADK